MAFKYVASTQDGKMKKGTVNLSTRESVINMLEGKNLVVVSVEEVQVVSARAASMGKLFLRISFIEKLLMTKHLSIMIKSGLTLLDAIRTLGEQSRSRAMRSLLGSIERKIERGDKFSDALEEYPRVFSKFYVNVVRAGELSGTLEGNLQHMATQFAKDNELRKKVKQAMLYPTIVIVAAALIGFFFATFVLPQVADVFSGLKEIQLPWTTRALLAISDFAKQHSILSFAMMMGTIGFVLWFLRRKFMRPITHYIILKTPIVGRISKLVNLARFSLILGTLLRSGVDILRALEISSQVLDNLYYRKALAAVYMDVQQGMALWESLAAYEDVFPAIVSRMIGVGERAGRLEEVLGYLNEFYELEVESTMKNLSSVLEPVLLLFIGLIALAMAFAILMPIYNYIGAIKDI
ncbi:MAG: type II secretion system F family protein [Patescibacteria group bacterium]|nr:type II secretion system F family protein [Patescibacteria group bacterium]